MASASVVASQAPLEKLTPGFCRFRKYGNDQLRIIAARGAITYCAVDDKPGLLMRFGTRKQRCEYDVALGGPAARGLSVLRLVSAALQHSDDVLAVVFSTRVPMTPTPTFGISIVRAKEVVDVLMPDDVQRQPTRMEAVWCGTRLLVTTDIACTVYNLVKDKLVLRQRYVTHHPDACAVLTRSAFVVGTLQAPCTVDEFVCTDMATRSMERVQSAESSVCFDTRRVVALDYNDTKELAAVCLADGSLHVAFKGQCAQVAEPSVRGDNVPDDQRRLIALNGPLLAMAYITTRQWAYVSVFDLRTLTRVRRCQQSVARDARLVGLHWTTHDDVLQLVTSAQVFSLPFTDCGCTEPRDCEQE